MGTVKNILAAMMLLFIVESTHASKTRIRTRQERKIEVNQTFEVELTEITTHLTIDFDVVESGYVELKLGEESESVCQASIRWPGGKAILAGVGTRIRVDGSGRQTGKIKLVCHESNLPKTVSLQIVFHEEMDFLEPNNNAADASEIELNRWYQIAYATAWDYEYVSVSIDEPGYLVVLTEGTSQTVGATEAFDESGEAIPNRTRSQLGLQPMFAVKPGRLLLKIGGPGTNPQLDPFRVKLAFVRKFNELMSEDGPIEFGKAYLFGRYGSHESTRFKLKLESAGIVSLNPRDLPSGLSHLRWQVVRNETVINNQRIVDPMNLAEGEYEVLVYTSGLGSALQQSIFTPSFQSNGEPDEYNDIPEYATKTKLNQPFETSIAPFNDIDLYRISVPGAGHLAIMPSGYDPYRNPDIGIDVLSADGLTVIGTTGQHPKLNLNRVVAVSQGEYLVRVRGVGKRAPKGRFMLEINYAGEGIVDAIEPSPGLFVGLVGIGLDETQQKEIQATALASNTPLVMNQDLDSLTETLAEITRQSISATKPQVVEEMSSSNDENPGPDGDTNWIYSLLSLIVAIGVVVFIVRKLNR